MILTIGIWARRMLQLARTKRNKPTGSTCGVGTRLGRWCCQHLDEEPVELV